MQTFLPYPDFARSAACLDMRRLGKQRLEALQLLTTDSPSRLNHPARLMWRGHERQLCLYGLAVCDEWLRRGHRDTLRLRIELQLMMPPSGSTDALPPWFGGAIHANHRARLLAKEPAWYGRLGWAEEPTESNYWPEEPRR